MLEGGPARDLCGSFAGSQRRCGLLDPSMHGRLHDDGKYRSSVSAIRTGLA